MEYIALKEKDVIKTLRDYGLTENEAQVYIFLAKRGIIKAGEMSNSLKMHKAQVYHILKNLQSKGLVESTLEFPMRFTTIPFEKVLDLLIKAKKEEAIFLEDKKEDLLAYWKSIGIEKSVAFPEKFVVIQGRSNIYSRILQLVEETNNEFLAITTNLGVIRADQAGIIDAIEKRDIQSRLLTYISKENLETTKKFVDKISKPKLSIEGRHTNFASNVCPRFVIKDEKEAIFFIAPIEDSSIISREDTGLWTDSKAFVSALKMFFDNLWRDAIDIEKRIKEIETGKPVEETIIVKNAETAYEKFREITCAAEKEIIGVTSLKGLVRFKRNFPIKGLVKKGVKIRLMVPFQEKNQETQLELCQIKYTTMNYLRMIIVDNIHFFQVKMPAADKETIEPMDSFENMFYTNDVEYVGKMSELLNELWKTSLDISKISLGSAMRSPPVKVSTSDPASKVVDAMLKNNVGSVIVVEDHTPVGIITEKDILSRVVKVNKELSRTSAKEIMSTPLVTIDSRKPLTEALETMKNKGIRRLVVTKKGNPIGILTERRTYIP
jgi:sugar-specific transcriptional regulator TrmB/CBS domain-containing protein